MPVLNFRTDACSEKALVELMADGSTASDAIRQALVDAVRLRRREQMRAESRALINDEADRAESRRVLAEMDDPRVWWHPPAWGPPRCPGKRARRPT